MAFSPCNVVKWCHSEAGHHGSASLLRQQFVPHHLLGFKRMLRLAETETFWCLLFLLMFLPIYLSVVEIHNLHLPYYWFSCAYHFKMVEDSRHLLYSLDNFHWSISIFSLSCHLFVKGHLPAHGGVVHLFTQKQATNISEMWSVWLPRILTRL